jgi:2',3'-cyclic-nucleotide 2'-phosphodiesterase (5'-nucleotidase family)
MGGVARRATAMIQSRRKYRDVPFLVAETGNEFKQSDNLEEPVNRWVISALDELGTDVINTSAGDLRRLNRLAELGRLPSVRAAYVATVTDETVKPQFRLSAQLVKTVRPEAGGAEVRVGILGVSSDFGAPEAIERTLARVMPDLDAQSDLVVLLARLPDDELARLARLFPSLDVIVNGSSVTEGREFQKTGNAVMVESARNGIALGMLELEWDRQGHVTKYKNELVPLPPIIADNARLAQLTDDARREAAQAEEQQIRSGPAKATVPSVYAGAKDCEACHEKAYKLWASSRHARAIDSLKPKSAEFDSNCVGCHVTAFGGEGGFINVLQTPSLVNVQCEACHGAALAHSNKPHNVHPGIGGAQQVRRMVTASFCIRCHTEERSPGFSFDKYWGKIAH